MFYWWMRAKSLHMQMSEFCLNVQVKRKITQNLWVVVPCIWFEIRINYQLDAIEYLFTLARHVSGLYAHLQEQWML